MGYLEHLMNKLFLPLGDKEHIDMFIDDLLLETAIVLIGKYDRMKAAAADLFIFKAFQGFGKGEHLLSGLSRLGKVEKADVKLSGICFFKVFVVGEGG